MTASHRKFGELLEEGIKRVHIVQKKPLGVILDEFGYELRPDGTKGRYALGHWYYKKRIPAEMADVEKLARLIVMNSDVDRNWLEGFLDSAGHPEPVKLCNQYFLELPPSQLITAPVQPEKPSITVPPEIEKKTSNRKNTYSPCKLEETYLDSHPVRWHIGGSGDCRFIIWQETLPLGCKSKDHAIGIQLVSLYEHHYPC